MSVPVKNKDHLKTMMALEGAMMRYEQVELKVEHYFANGTYTRELHIPAGTILTGQIHRESCINILSKGKMRVATSDGMKEVEAPHTFVSQPGEKKAGVALEDSVWVNVHPWNGEDNLDQLEAKIVVPAGDFLTEDEKEVLPCLG